ncbi:leucine Rich repeat-containing domain protein, partial [Ancylostoma duodenale]
LKPFHLDISGTCEKTCSSVLEASLVGVQCSSLSLRDNNLETEMQAVVHALGNIKTLRRLDLGGANLLALRRSSKQAHAAIISKTILDVVKLFSDDSPLEELILSDARLGPHLSVLLNTLGAATSLRYLDISNNDLGHFGARILSKILLYTMVPARMSANDGRARTNASLRTIVIDNNHLGVEGLYDLATAVNMNRTITSIPYPVQDVCECLTRAGCDRSRVLGAMTQIESCLERNRQPANAEMANFRITAGALDLGNPEKWNAVGEALSSAAEEPFPTRLEDMVDDFVEQALDLGNPEKWNAVGEALSSAAEEPFPTRLEDMVDDFVEQARRECVLNLQDTFSRLRSESGDSPKTPGKAEQIAVQRLKELWMDDIKRVYSDWRWRELCERSEAFVEKLGTSADGVSNTSVSQNGSPRQFMSPSTPRCAEPGHRPRSIIGDLQTPLGLRDEEPGISLDTPPQPSALVHLQKSRPRLQRRAGAHGQARQAQTNHEETPMSRSTDIEEEAQSNKSGDSGDGDIVVKKHPSERAGFRVAMLPDAAALSQAALRSAADRAMSPKPESPGHGSALSSPGPSSSPRAAADSDSPPPLPHRMKSLPAVPPLLPPKPVPRSGQPSNSLVTESNDASDENANNRRSVADMAKIFNR